MNNVCINLLTVCQENCGLDSLSTPSHESLRRDEIDQINPGGINQSISGIIR